jgi:hypothetical protein
VICPPVQQRDLERPLHVDSGHLPPETNVTFRLERKALARGWASL